MVINRKERFATEGCRFQRHNGDGTIPTPQRFLGFANQSNLSKIGQQAKLTIKVDTEPAETKTVSFAGVSNINRVTAQETAAALNAAGFTDVKFSVDAKTGRLKGSYGAYGGGTSASVTVRLENVSGADAVIDADSYALTLNGAPFNCVVEDAITLEDGETTDLIFISSQIGSIEDLPEAGDPVDAAEILPALADDVFEGSVTAAADGTNPQMKNPKIIQVTGRLAAALDFGQGIKHGGNGLEIISFFDDETISIGLAKDIKDKEEIDIEGAKGTVTRMVIGAMLQGLSPVVTLKENDYHLLEMIQGGKLDREKGTYDPPLSSESDHIYK
jgi:hypothetical protein